MLSRRSRTQSLSTPPTHSGNLLTRKKMTKENVRNHGQLHAFGLLRNRWHVAIQNSAQTNHLFTMTCQMHGWDFPGYSWISGCRYLSECIKNGFETHFECEFTFFGIQTIIRLHPCKCLQLHILLWHLLLIFSRCPW